MGKCRGRIRLKKLDYFLCNDRWLDVFPNGKIETLPRTTSDHAPLLFHVLSPRPSGARPFRFLNIWLQHPCFAELVKTSWSAPIAASGMFKLAGKLARLKAELKTWNRIAFGNIFERKNQSEQEVQDAEAALDLCPNSVNAARLDSAYRSLQLRLKAEEEYWRQKAGLRWLNEGDANTNFFYATVKMKQHSLGIHKLIKPDGSWSEGVELDQFLVSHFCNLYKDRPISNSAVDSILSHSPHSISPAQNASLTRPTDALELFGYRPWRIRVLLDRMASRSNSSSNVGCSWLRIWSTPATTSYLVLLSLKPLARRGFA
ncbi:hypothetical protein HPP92_004817 [Vanilla planifolia]|uniref:Reverse transcriptase n=1 Tax=Vanilla planifolia TaxID=51239 RepID=A0A835VE03_VANPL|nr:hypothetical protein HPP92_004817 [Vanilla planifolia]